MMGRVPERSNGPVLKTVDGETRTRVRISPLPQIVKRQRCARRGGGRGEHTKASQRGKFKAAAA